MVTFENVKAKKDFEIGVKMDKPKVQCDAFDEEQNKLTEEWFGKIYDFLGEKLAV